MEELDWMHPSYRDLIIDELVINRDLRIQFLTTATLHDLGLALSDSGGPDGQRKMPFIVDDESKDIVCRRFIELSKELSDIEIYTMLEILDSSIKEFGTNTTWMLPLLDDVLKSLLDRWNRKEIWDSTLVTYCKTTLFFHPLVRLPDFEPTWNVIIRRIESNLKDDDYLDAYLIKGWANLIDLLQKNEPRFLTQVEFPGKYKWLFEKIICILEEEIKWDLVAPTQEEISREAERIGDLIESLENLGSVVVNWNQRLIKIIRSLDRKKSELLEHVDPEPDYDIDEDDSYHNADQDFDIDRLFADL